MRAKPDRIALGPGLDISRIVTGLWQISDMEKDGGRLDADALAVQLADYAEAGFDSFDMADHYGSAEEVAGLFNASARASNPRLLTKWCPEPAAVTAAMVRAAVERARHRLRTSQIDLLQFHWWMFQH